MQITLTAPAKVNLCLKVAGKRLDGYHQVVTLMQPLSIGDRLTVGIDGQGLAFTCSDQSLQNEDNLVLRAARLWFDEAGVKARASFHLQKQLPVAAGLGGGSSDAAATLLGLNVLHGGILTPQRLHSLAAALGSDVPFFLGGVTAFCTGKGDKVHPWPEFPLWDYVLVNPGFPLSTEWVYKQFDFTWTISSVRNRINASGSYESVWDRILVNDLEMVAFEAYPELTDIKQALYASGALATMMSGSGPTVFGVFADQDSAVTAARALASKAGSLQSAGLNSEKSERVFTPRKGEYNTELGVQAGGEPGGTAGPKQSSGEPSWWVRACRGIIA